MHTKLFSSKFKYIYTNLFSKCACFWPWAESSCCLAVSCLVDSRAPAGVAVSLFFPQPVGLLSDSVVQVVCGGGLRIASNKSLPWRQEANLCALCAFLFEFAIFLLAAQFIHEYGGTSQSPSLPECGWCLLYKEYMVLPQLEKSAFFMCIYP